MRRSHGWVKVALLVAVGLALCGLAAVYALRSPAVAVKTEAARLDSVSENLDEDGLVRSDVEVNLAPRVQGRLQRLAVASGSLVQRGQLIATLDQADLKAAWQAAQANERAATVAVAEARDRYRLQADKNQADLHSARASVAGAQANLSKATHGARPQERRSAQAARERAQARVEEARRELARKQRLFDKGYVPRSELESAQTTLEVNRTSLDEMRANLSQIQEGPRSEERSALAAELQRTRAQLELAASQETQLAISQRQIQAAQARLESSRAQVQQARATLDQGGVRAPAPGRIDLENHQPGEVVSPQTVVARLTDPARIWVEILVNENDRGKVRVGQKAQIAADAYPNESFAGHLRRIDSVAFLKRELRNTPTQDEDRVFRARVELEAGRGKLFPGMTVFAEIELRRVANVLTVPREALVNREGHWLVLVDRDGVAVEREVQVGQRDVARVEIKSGIAAGAKVILNPGSLKAGTRVRS